LRRSSQRELNDFFGRLNNSEYSIQMVTKSAFSQARSKLKPDAFIELSHSSVDFFYDNSPYLLWDKHRLLACDGSTIRLPDSQDIREKFTPTGFGPNADAESSLATISLIYDPLNLVTLNAKIDAYNVSEITLLKEQLQEVSFKPDDILLIDRGYPSIGLLYELHHRKIGFCVRLKDNWWKAVNEMLKTGKTDKIVTFVLPKKDKSLQQLFKGKTDSVTVRISVIELEDGKKEILCTSLLDTEKYTLEDLKQLYHFRWGIEEAYKLFKVRADMDSFSGMTALSVKQDFYAGIFSMNLCAMMSFPIEQKVRADMDSFSGMTALSVKQDFYAGIFSMNLCAMMSFPIEQKVREESKEAELKNTKMVNRTNAFSLVRESMVGVFLKKKIKGFLKTVDNILQKTTEAIRSNRTFPRNHKQKKPKSMNYKIM